MKQQKYSMKISFSSQEIPLAPTSYHSTDADFTGYGMTLSLSRLELIHQTLEKERILLSWREHWIRSQEAWLASLLYFLTFGTWIGYLIFNIFFLISTSGIAYCLLNIKVLEFKKALNICYLNLRLLDYYLIMPKDCI